MTKEEAIKYLQQLYPNGGHCWLDEQRIEAISMAIKALQEEPVSIWHDSSEEPNDKSSCLIHYIVGGEVSYRDIFPVLYNKEAREFVSEPYPHPTGYKVEQSSLEGGVVAEVYKDMRDRFPISDIYKWAYIDDILNLSNVERTVKNWKEPVSEDLEEASKEWLTPQLDKSYAVYGEVKMMELTHFDGYAMLDAIEFGADWGKNQAKVEIQAQSIALAHGCPKESVTEDLGEYINKLSNQFPEVSFAKLSRIAVRVAKWQKEQLMVKAFDFTKEHNTACVLASECLRVHGWFNRERDFNDLFRHLSCVDELFAGKFSGKTKVIVIKED